MESQKFGNPNSFIIGNLSKDAVDNNINGFVLLRILILMSIYLRILRFL